MYTTRIDEINDGIQHIMDGTTNKTLPILSSGNNSVREQYSRDNIELYRPEILQKAGIILGGFGLCIIAGIIILRD